MKILLSIVGLALLGALIIVIAMQTAALAIGLLVIAGGRCGPLVGTRGRIALGKCAGVAAGSTLVGLVPLGILLAPACSVVGVRILFPVTWRQAALVVLLSIVVGLGVRVALGT
ncbi:MAG: hypothetical protein ACYTJ0_13840 [Planctomycetota bacterium]|jgi:hypothetical protein